LYRSEIPGIVKALSKRKLAERYRDMRENWAFLASVATNGFLGLAASMSGKRRKPKLTSPDDFISKDFKRLMEQMFRDNWARPGKQTDWAPLIQDAKEKGLRGPW
jgi:hypothetical protein